MQTELHALRNVVRGSQSPRSLPKIRRGLPSTQDRLHMTGLVSVHRPCFTLRWAGALSLPSAPTAGGGGLHLGSSGLEAASQVRGRPHTLHPVSWISSSEILATPTQNSPFLEFSLLPILRLTLLSSGVTVRFSFP